MEAIDQLVQEAAKAGCVMVGAGGLLPTSAGARVRLAGGKLTVTDGPFAEAKEVVGGYAIFDVKSKKDMIEWTLRFMDSKRSTCRAGRARPRSASSQRWAPSPAAIPTNRRWQLSDAVRGRQGRGNSW
jgi:hypothetical protein